MTLPCPKIDNRTFEDIVEEAKRKIPELCPWWTDFNPGDPGITMIELMAWMTEMIIYRLNRVPEKNYIKFLELMGISLTAAQSARAWVVFKLAGNPQQDNSLQSPSGIRISTKGTHQEPIVFETISPLYLTTSYLKKMMSIFKDSEGQSVRRERELPQEEKVTELKDFPFDGKYMPSPHFLYLGLSHISEITDMNRRKCLLNIEVELETASASGLHLEWEYSDGEGWSIIIPCKDTTDEFTKNGVVQFNPLPKIELASVNGKRAFWIRARYLSGKDFPVFRSISRSIQLNPEYRPLPDKSFLSTEAVPYHPIDLFREYYPFGKTPKKNDMVYFGSWIFALDSQVIIDVRLSKEYDETAIEKIKDTRLHWEYYSESEDWKPLGVSEPTANFSESFHDFSDTTQAFTENGTISFHSPNDISLLVLQGEENFWVRARIDRGDFNTLDHDPPIITSLLIRFQQTFQPFEYYLSQNYFSQEKDITANIAAGKPIEPFNIDPNEDTAFYLAFATPLENRCHRIYFHIEFEAENFHSVIWEYSARNGSVKELRKNEDETSSIWKELKLTLDSTKSLSYAGAIEFVAPANWADITIYETTGYWLRARWMGGAENKAPKILGVHLNAVEVMQEISHHDEILGSSTGEASQVFRFNHSPIRPDPEIIVKEVSHPSEEEIPKYQETLKKNVTEKRDEKSGEAESQWVRWQAVDNFFQSKSDSRHFIIDLFEGTIQFGDGMKGMIPPQGKDNVKCKVYYVGGGANGNVGSDTITQLMSSVPFVDSVTNPYPAGGGADAETIEEAKLRGPWTIKHRHRAVTIKDFEYLAKESSGEVAKAKCFSDGDTIKVVIIPKYGSDKLQPGVMLINRVRRFLDARRLITTKLQVIGPTYIDIVIETKIVALVQKYSETNIPMMKHEIETSLRHFFHPLTGGPKNEGWPMGRSVHISEIYYLLEKSTDIDHVEDVYLRKVGGSGDDRISMTNANGDVYLPFLREIKIDVLKLV